ncbi:MAG: TRAP transporter small permease subunit [Burkholderiales bacterium]|nr:TRAP transporter small permease subunit [Burkholderiales bacterium]MDE2564849.1 TRAP transporter small permease subunit [Burkholderiales bacterium]
MSALLQISRLIDAFTARVGRYAAWLIMAAVLISALNAVVRKLFDMSSNAYLEVQWYLFSAAFLLAAGYTLLRQEHVRIDVVIGRFSKRTQIAIEAACLVLFLFPFCLTVIVLVWPLVARAYLSGEMSQNAGGLIRWPVYAMVPLGFALLLLQGVSELIKRIGFLMGRCDDPTRKLQAKTAEEELAEFVRAQAEGGPKP